MSAENKRERRRFLAITHMTTSVHDSAKLSLRPSLASDESLLFRLYASTRTQELAFTAWDETQWNAFLQMQFNLQKRSYEARFPAADHSIILYDEQEIGRLVVDRTATENHLIDIALLPEFRGRGIGGALVRELQEGTARDGKSLRLSVLKTNPARRLYERLGFSIENERGAYCFMLWHPSAHVESLSERKPGQVDM
jgi:ribosomal protein S18 acetylase RimI-like enzyme